MFKKNISPFLTHLKVLDNCTSLSLLWKRSQIKLKQYRILYLPKVSWDNLYHGVPKWLLTASGQSGALHPYIGQYFHQQRREKQRLWFCFANRFPSAYFERTLISNLALMATPLRPFHNSSCTICKTRVKQGNFESVC